MDIEYCPNCGQTLEPTKCSPNIIQRAFRLLFNTIIFLFLFLFWLPLLLFGCIHDFVLWVYEEERELTPAVIEHIRHRRKLTIDDAITEWAVGALGAIFGYIIFFSILEVVGII